MIDFKVTWGGYVVCVLVLLVAVYGFCLAVLYQVFLSEEENDSDD